MDSHVTDRGGFGGRAGNALLTVAAIGGAVCIVLVLIAFFFHITLIMFKTGSMSPTIPAGSLAIVKQIPASDIRVGDVVTVDRRPALPVTHRVTSVSPAAGDTRTITLRGDANPAEDPAPYVVSNVRIVLFSIPQLAYAVNAVSNPLALGAITIGAAGLVTWAFWPHGAPAPRPRRGARRRSTRCHAARTGGLAVIVLLTLSAPVVNAAAPANAAVTDEVIQGPVLTLTSVADKTLMAHLVPAVPVPWQIGVAAHPDNPGVVSISLTAQGGLAADPNGLRITVSMCEVRWVGGRCQSGGTVLLGPGPASTLIPGPLVLTSMPSGQQRWILIDAALPANQGSVPTGSATFNLTASGVGDELSTGGSVSSLASTGADLWPPLLAALGAVTTGLMLASSARLPGARQRRRARVTP
ncbi:signal peptidase I [Pseudarthrobacter sp. S9]